MHVTSPPPVIPLLDQEEEEDLAGIGKNLVCLIQFFSHLTIYAPFRLRTE
jgi:hypothetical protein